ncbi:MAG TPA: hypothetical protein PK640_04100 [Verrucomicrobiota bacterium]|nr:hypothetical protein [Verrucomicrobiota bacterium]
MKPANNAAVSAFGSAAKVKLANPAASNQVLAYPAADWRKLLFTQLDHNH